MNLAKTWQQLGKFLIQWTAITTGGGAIAYLLAVVIGSAIGGNLTGLFWVGIPAGGVAGGIVVGSFQRRILHPLIPVTNQWVWVTAMGWAVCIPFLIGLSGWISALTRAMQGWYALTLFLIGAGISGALSGSGQWYLLRPKIDKALWWLLACGIGWLLAWLSVLGLWWLLGQGRKGLPFTLEEIVPVIALGAIAGWMVGIEQGVALVGLIAQAEWEARRDGVV
ncbi:MAG: hypothetical protein ACE5GO_08945 [Anaerolineales bacterium]